MSDQEKVLNLFIELFNDHSSLQTLLSTNMFKRSLVPFTAKANTDSYRELSEGPQEPPRALEGEHQCAPSGMPSMKFNTVMSPHGPALMYFLPQTVQTFKEERTCCSDAHRSS